MCNDLAKAMKALDGKKSTHQLPISLRHVEGNDDLALSPLATSRESNTGSLSDKSAAILTAPRERLALVRLRNSSESLVNTNKKTSQTAKIEKKGAERNIEAAGHLHKVRNYETWRPNQAQAASILKFL